WRSVMGGWARREGTEGAYGAGGNGEPGVVQRVGADGTDLPGKLQGHEREVLALTYSPDGRRLVTGGADRVVKVWSSSGVELLTLAGHTDFVEGLAFSPDGRWLAGAGRGKGIMVWDGTPAGERPARPRGPRAPSTPPRPRSPKPTRAPVSRRGTTSPPSSPPAARPRPDRPPRRSCSPRSCSGCGPWHRGTGGWGCPGRRTACGSARNSRRRTTAR